MRRVLTIASAMVIVMIFSTTGVQAYDYATNFGRNITIWDEVASGTNANPWYSNVEDQEVEPESSRHQQWDLEAFFMSDDYKLSMVSGYDFATTSGNAKSGDIYFDLGGSTLDGTTTAKFGLTDHDPNLDAANGNAQAALVYNRSSNGNLTVEYNWGYDLVADINHDSFTWNDTDNAFYFEYDLVALNADSKNISTTYQDWDESGAWRYVDGGTVLNTALTGSYIMGLDNGDGITGGLHNAVTLDMQNWNQSLAGLGFGITDQFVSHYTMQCGNDNLMGDSSEVPEPTTLMLVGFGLLGFAYVRRKSFIK